MYMYSVFHFENILCVVNSQSFDFGGVRWNRARGHYVIFTVTAGRGPKEKKRQKEREKFKRMKEGRKLFSNQHRNGAPRYS